MSRTRFAIAIGFACLFVAGGFAFVRYSDGLMKARFDQARERLKAKRDAGALPPEWQGVDLDKLDMADYAIRLPAWDEWCISTGRWMSRLWYLWVPLVFAVCLRDQWFETWIVSRWK